MNNYFPHPSNLRQSSGCVTLLIEEGYAGYGIYLAILELLRDAPSYRYNPDPKVWKYLLHSDDLDLVTRVLQNFGLFTIDDDGLLISPWLIEQMDGYDEKKKKLQEAGQRGAAKRWAAAHKEDRQAIATLSVEDRQAIAYNITKPNITQHNETPPTNDNGDDWREMLKGEVLSLNEELFTQLGSLCKSGTGQGYVLQECWRRGLSLNAYNYIVAHSNGADLTSTTYKAFCALCRRVDAEKYPIKYPDNFFLSKLFG